MTSYERKIINALLNKYENSKSFVGTNEKKQSFCIKPEKLFPKYKDAAEYELFLNVNTAAAELEARNYVIISKGKNGMIESITLNMFMLSEIYNYASRIPKTQINQRLTELLNEYSSQNEILSEYCKAQIIRLSENKKAEFFDGDITEYQNILKAVSAVFGIEEETYIRDFSVKVFGDSKVFEKIKNKVSHILFKYGSFAKEETIFEELNIVKNPGHVFVKGCGKITISGQTIDLSRFDGDIAISSALLKSIDNVTVTGDKVITVENLTTFNKFSEMDAFVIYLGGYHNSHRRNFIRKIYRDNPDILFYHYGDIDAGGFYILLHLRKNTNIDFIPYNMDIKTLKKYFIYTKPLTENDRKRLNCLSESEFSNTVNYMLENNCKLEQEAIDR